MMGYVEITDLLTCHRRRLEVRDPVPGEDQSDEPGHIGERAGPDVVHDVVRQVQREELRLRKERAGQEFL